MAHPNVQQLLASMWYEGLPGFRQMNMILQVRRIMMFSNFDILTSQATSVLISFRETTFKCSFKKCASTRTRRRRYSGTIVINIGCCRVWRSAG